MPTDLARNFHTRLLPLILLVFIAACSPDPAIIATLTMLPGTPTPRPPTPYPSRTPSTTGLAGTATISPDKCPPFSYDTTAPDDASQMAGRHYDLKRLPEIFQQPESGALSDPQFRWVRVRWQGRSLYWIDRQVCVDKIAWPHWEVVDALALPRLDPGMGELETRSCYSGSEPLPDVIAYGMLDTAQTGEKTLKVQGAWKMTPQSAGQQFITLDPGDLRCTVEE